MPEEEPLSEEELADLEYEINIAIGQQMEKVVAALTEAGLPPDRFSAYGHIYYERLLRIEEMAMVVKAHEICGVPMGSWETGIIPAGKR